MRTKLRLLSALSCSVGVTGVGEITARKQKRHRLPAAQVGLKALAMVARERRVKLSAVSDSKSCCSMRRHRSCRSCVKTGLFAERRFLNCAEVAKAAMVVQMRIARIAVRGME